ncbi:hypothetical protein DPMN_130201 [Dreissena polymorpha]|uniref:Uncharacterized protein n=1 Tax=Dreissena polymorpha TaxID=45954 RepID=A0A9D4H471_DREPO|nr:hypothetical protein DPMN_130201 [Dreissena polymorpha]
MLAHDEVGCCKTVVIPHLPQNDLANLLAQKDFQQRPSPAMQHGRHGNAHSQEKMEMDDHVLRMDNDSIPKVALQWNPEGKRQCKKASARRPKQSWRRTVIGGDKRPQPLLCDPEKACKRPITMRTFVAALHDIRRERQ